MSAPRLTLIHTVPGLVGTFSELAGELIGDRASIVHVVDESLLADTIAAGELTPAVARRVAGQALAAQDAGAAAILVTCSSIGAAVEASRPFCSVPLLRVDEPMIDRALEVGGTIGVIGTLATTLEPTTDLVRRRGEGLGADAAIESRLCEGAFDALRAGDLERHDELVRAELRDLVARSDVVVLAQASMARVADQLGDEERGSVPILSSPRSGLERAARVVLDDESGQRG